MKFKEKIKPIQKIKTLLITTFLIVLITLNFKFASGFLLKNKSKTTIKRESSKNNLSSSLQLTNSKNSKSKITNGNNNDGANKNNLKTSSNKSTNSNSNFSKIFSTLQKMSKTFYKSLDDKITKMRESGPKRIENSSWIALGYNVAYGNPILSPENGKLIDAGLTTAIFKQSFERKNETPDGLYIYPDGYEIMPAQVCKTNFSSQVLQSSSSLKSSMSLSLGAEAGYGPYSFSANTEFNNMSEAMNSEDKLYISNQATCSTYRAVLNKFNPPELAENFVHGLLTLANKAFEDAANKSLYYTFIDTFGMHYLYDIMMGSRYTLVEETTKKAMNEMKSQGLNISAEAKASAMASVSVKTSLNNKDEKNNKYENSITNKFVTSIGAPVPASMDMKEWLSGTSVLPMPISYSLRTITELFQVTEVIKKLAEKGINAEHIAVNLQKAIDGYCTHLLEKKAIKTCSADIPNPTTRRYLYTGFTDNGGGNIFFLDRQNINCENSEALNYIKLENGDKTIRYKVICVKSDSISNNCLMKETGPQDVADSREESLIFLDRHKIECDENYVLRGFSLKRNNDKIYYKYNCCKASVKNSFEFNSNATNPGNGSISNLSLQEIDAKENNVIKSFQLISKQGKVNYKADISTLK